MKCIHCGSTHLQKRGKVKLSFGTTAKRYECRTCGRFFQGEPRHNRSAKILLLDIETLPMEFYAWSPYADYLSYKNMKKDWSISCWAAKWLFEPEIIGETVSPKEAIARKDDSVLGKIWSLIDQASIVVTHNGLKFDIKKLNTRFLLGGYSPPSPYLNVDTKAVSKNVFGNSYNHLEELGRKFGIGVKTKMELEDWIKCAEGNQEYLTKMFNYCKRDVAPLLEDVYLKLLPWMPSHPNLGVYSDGGDVCRNCESTDISWNTQYATPQGLWEGWRCNACGAVGRGTSKIHKIKSVTMK